MRRELREVKEREISERKDRPYTVNSKDQLRAMISSLNCEGSEVVLIEDSRGIEIDVSCREP